MFCRSSSRGLLPDPGQAGELELEQQGGRILADRGHELVAHEAHGPAAGSVLEPHQSLQQRLVLQRIVPARHPAPAARQRPLPGQVELLEKVLSEAIAEVEHLAGLGLVTQGNVELLRLPLVQAEGRPEVRRPGPGERAAHQSQHVRAAGRCDGRLRRQRDLLRLEVVALRDGSADPLGAGRRVEQARGQRSADLVGVVDPVPAAELVLGEQLGQVEVGLRRYRTPAAGSARRTECTRSTGGARASAGSCARPAPCCDRRSCRCRR